MGEGLLARLLQVALARTQVLGDPVSQLGRNLNALNDGAEQIRELLLADVRIAAAPVEARAAVVGVLALLAFSGHGAAAAGAGEQPHEGVLLLGVPGARLPVQHILDLLEPLTGDQGRMRAPVHLPEPPEITGIDHILEDAVDLGLHHATA
ncbi:MAG: hypothetical protein A3H29_05620 [Acidobacteria bacterium RIFCSPLOWO2_02_FULL_67_21]|nr:MAG: hypothetical protein A3H29_05620 [Acidobacteria bacterium RIFCSPLOWO2_02_FULL_67_21]